MDISSDEYNALNAAQKQELKDRTILKYTTDTTYEDMPYENTEYEDTAYEDAADEGAEDENTAYEDPSADNAPADSGQPEITDNAPKMEASGSNDTAAKTDADRPVVLRRRLGIAGNTRAGRILIAFSKIGLILSLIGGVATGILVGNEMYAPVGIAFGIGLALICALLCLVLMGIGELSILLASVNAKLDEK
jgi:hypothetical protein